MSFRVSTAGFEGPFDLLLALVTRQKVDIGAVSVAQVAEQYLAEVERMGDLDLEVASDFVLVASTLLDIKAAALMPAEEPRPGEGDEELASLTPEELRDVLVARLLAYRQYKGAAAALAARAEAEARMHPRTAGPDPEFAGLMPDYLEGIPLRTLGVLCAELMGRRERVLLESEHIAPRRIPLETRVGQVDAVVRARRRLSFEELLGDEDSVPDRVVSLLALLELCKRRMLTLEQPEIFGEILIEAVEGAAAWDDRDAAGLSAEGGDGLAFEPEGGADPPPEGSGDGVRGGADAASEGE